MDRVRRPGSILGTQVRRTEDPDLLTGTARFVADLPLDRPLHAVFVRSEIAHGVVAGVATAHATAAPGVTAVWVAADLALAPFHGMKVHDHFARPPLATDRVRFVGEPIAVVFADTVAAGRDAAELVLADITPLPAITDPEQALAPDAGLVFPEHGSNLALRIPAERTPRDGARDIDAEIVVRGRYVNQRMAVAPIEPDGIAAAVADDGRLTVWPSTQLPHIMRRALAAALGIDRAAIHVVTPRVGGGFGGKAGLRPEHLIVAAAALRLGRPVIWTPTRSEDMQTLPHSRAQVQYVELGCTPDGRFGDLRVGVVGDAGAYPGVGAMLPGATRRMAQGTYHFDSIRFDVAVGVTNTTPMGAYRGAGRPEATALLERLVDHAALELGIDPIELRLTNLVGEDEFPFTTLMGSVYDSGRYAHALTCAAQLAGYDELRREQARRRADGDRMLLGIGVACYVEVTAGGESEYAAVEVHSDGSATVFAGTAAHGQGHQTAYAMLVADQTGIPIERITLVDGDTDRVPRGNGTGGSRSMQLGGSAVHEATAAMVERARNLAARMLEASVDDVVVDVVAGTVGVAGVPAAALSWAELAAHSLEVDGAALDGSHVFQQADATYPFGAHIAVVEVDRETGATRIARHIAVDDCGTVINPLLVRGQQHGGAAAGIGQALFEEVRFDDDGNPITSNFTDYAIVSAAELPSFEVASTVTPTPLNPLGAKGIGEAATIGATPAVQNAVIDAVAHLGVRHIDLPCTPERVWRAIDDADRGTLAEPWRQPPAVFDGA